MAKMSIDSKAKHTIKSQLEEDMLMRNLRKT